MTSRRQFIQAAITLPQFEPKSTLRVKETPIARARHPVIDVHTHVFGLNRRPDAALLKQIAAWMDQCNLETLVNLTGGNSETLPAIKQAIAPHGRRFVTGAEPVWKRVNEPEFPKWQADELAKCKAAGAICVKVLKSLGLGHRDRNGKLIAIDDKRLDPMWEAAGGLGLPVLIHTSDPAPFFTPIDRFNERYEELQRHPEWSFYGKDYPKRDELLSARNRVIERHPKTTFVGLHVANSPEDLERAGQWLDRYRNLNCETGARLGELGRQPRTARRFFERYQDRILFGTDATPNAGIEYPQQDLRPEMFRCYFRFLETEDEYFDYAPSAVPPQGRWRVYGIALPDAILKKVYRDNAIRILRIH
jgi:predicted TIM-barrel fold metal-dependent hydrolase